VTKEEATALICETFNQHDTIGATVLPDDPHVIAVDIIGGDQFFVEVQDV
jgi:hypothetical protein